MKIAVLLSRAEHPQSGRIIASPLDIKACSIALQLQQQLQMEREGKEAIEVDFVHFGDNNPALKDYLGYGIESIDCYPAMQDFDTAQAAKNLVEKTKDYDLLIAGRKAMSGFASGMFAYHLAQALHRPLHANIIELMQKSDSQPSQSTYQATQYLPSGYRRSIDLQFPAVISIHEAAISKLNFSYSKQRTGNIQIHTTTAISKVQELNHTWQIQASSQQRTRLKITSALSNLSADERMRQAVSTDSASGGKVHRVSAAQAAHSIWQTLLDKKLVVEADRPLNNQ